MEGFTGRSSLLYHLVPPTQTHQIERVTRDPPRGHGDGVHRHRLVKTGGVEPTGNVVQGRVPLFFNSDVSGRRRPPKAAAARGIYYRNGEADEMLFVHEGTGRCESNFGPMRYGPGDYIVIPIGTTWRLAHEGSEQRMLYLESPSEIVPPKRYRNDWGQLLEHSPFSQRDIRVPEEVDVRDEEGDFVIWVRVVAAGSRRTTTSTTRSTSSAGMASSSRTSSTSATSSRSPGASTSHRRSTRRSPAATTSSARSCRASSTTTRSRSRRPTTTRTSTPTRSSTTSPATS